MSEQNRQKLFAVIAAVLEVEPEAIQLTTRRDDFAHWDSLNHLNICVAIGQEFNVQLSALDMELVDSVADLVRVLQAAGIDPA